MNRVSSPSLSNTRQLHGETAKADLERALAGGGTIRPREQSDDDRTACRRRPRQATPDIYGAGDYGGKAGEASLLRKTGAGCASAARFDFGRIGAEIDANGWSS